MTLEQLPLIMIRALVLTILIECTIAWVLGVRDKRGQQVVALVNLMTNPVVVSFGAATMLFIGREYLLPVTLIMEIAVIVIEGVVYRRKYKYAINPFVLSLACNCGSYLIGEVLNRYVF